MNHSGPIRGVWRANAVSQDVGFFPPQLLKIEAKRAFKALSLGPDNQPLKFMAAIERPQTALEINQA